MGLPPMPGPAKRAQKRRAHASWIRRVRAGGFTRFSLTLPRDLAAQADVQADHWGYHRSALLRAAMVVGLRQLRPSDVIAVEQQWRHVIGLPIAAVKPGRPFDASRRPSLADLGTWQDRWRAWRASKEWPNAKRA